MNLDDQFDLYIYWDVKKAHVPTTSNFFSLKGCCRVPGFLERHTKLTGALVGYINHISTR